MSPAAASTGSATAAVLSAAVGAAAASRALTAAPNAVEPISASASSALRENPRAPIRRIMGDSWRTDQPTTAPACTKQARGPQLALPVFAAGRLGLLGAVVVLVRER